MQKLGLFGILLLISWRMDAQTNSRDYTGEYYLRGVMETASGFKLNPDSSFQFFFSYGALDRMGSGKWTVRGNELILNSRPRPPLDFKLVSSTAGDAKNITIRISDPNQNILRYVDCTVSSAKGSTTLTTDHDGYARFPLSKVDSIGLIFTWCPDRVSYFKVTNSAHHYFEFRFEPWIAEVFFDNFKLNIDKEGFEGPHPLMADKRFHYEKAR